MRQQPRTTETGQQSLSTILVSSGSNQRIAFLLSCLGRSWLPSRLSRALLAQDSVQDSLQGSDASVINGFRFSHLVIAANTMQNSCPRLDWSCNVHLPSCRKVQSARSGHTDLHLGHDVAEECLASLQGLATKCQQVACTINKNFWNLRPILPHHRSQLRCYRSRCWRCWTSCCCRSQ